MFCPICSSERYVKRGKTAAGSQRYKCSICKKTFTDSPKIPFEFISFMLYKKAWLERNDFILLKSSFKDLTNHFLTLMDFNKKKVPYATVYYWVKAYSESFTKISHKKALQFVRQHTRKLTQKEIEQANKEYEEYMEKKKPAHKYYLRLLPKNIWY